MIAGLSKGFLHRPEEKCSLSIHNITILKRFEVERLFSHRPAKPETEPGTSCVLVKAFWAVALPLHKHAF